jgi:branched-chain amino acid transport system permease protein
MAHFLVFRPLRNAAPLGKVVGSLGVMLYLQGVALRNFGTSNDNPTEVLPKGLFRNFLGLGKPLSQEAFWYAIIAVVVGLMVWSVYRFTRFGLATRAAAGNEKGASLLGYSPETLALSNWIISALLAGLAGALSGTLTGALDPVKYTGLLMPALGAALIGGLSSVPLAVAGGLLMGMLQTFSTTWLAARPWFPHWLSGAVKDALPLLVIVIMLFARGKSLPTRGTVEEKRLPLSPTPVRVLPWTIIGSTVAIIAGFILTGYWAFALTTTLIASMLMLGYVVLTSQREWDRAVDESLHHDLTGVSANT